MSFHNMQALMSTFGTGQANSATVKKAEEFDKYLFDTCCSEEACTTDGSGQSVRISKLEQWKSAPSAIFCHPREEHLIPLMVCAGAAEGEKGVRFYSNQGFGMATSSFKFG